MAKPFANSKHFSGEILDSYLIGIQTGQHTNADGLGEMMYVRASELRAFMREGMASVYNYRGEYNTLPTDLAVGDTFYASSTFTVDDDTYTQGHLYAWNGATWDDITNIFAQYASVAQLATKADKLPSGSGNIPVLNNDGNIANSGIQPSEVIRSSDVVNDTSSLDTDKPLSAYMGYEMQQEINNLRARGRFLSAWNCVTGLPSTNPIENPYPYKAGDYFIVSTTVESLKANTPAYDPTADYVVGALAVENNVLYKCNTPIVGGEVFDPTHWDAITDNYRPSGIEYDSDDPPSSTVETAEVNVNDFYAYDGSTWLLLNNTQKTVSFANLAGNPSDNAALAAELNYMVKHSNDLAGSAVPINADQLNGHADTYFGKASDVAANTAAISSLRIHKANVTVTTNGNGEVRLPNSFTQSNSLILSIQRSDATDYYTLIRRASGGEWGIYVCYCSSGVLTKLASTEISIDIYYIPMTSIVND